MATTLALPTLETLTKDERSLLIYLESCAVDRWGKVNAVPQGQYRFTQQMNEEDNRIARRWHEIAFIDLREATPAEMAGNDGRAIKTTHMVRLSDVAWTIAHALRRERGERHAVTVVPERTMAVRDRAEDLAREARVVCGGCGVPLVGLRAEDYERLITKISWGKPEKRAAARECVWCEECAPVNHWVIMLEEIDDPDGDDPDDDE